MLLLFFVVVLAVVIVFVVVAFEIVFVVVDVAIVVDFYVVVVVIFNNLIIYLFCFCIRYLCFIPATTADEVVAVVKEIVAHLCISCFGWCWSEACLYGRG